MTSIMVVLPAPFGPMMARISPGSTVRERSLSARKPSNDTETASRYRSADVVRLCMALFRGFRPGFRECACNRFPPLVVLFPQVPPGSDDSARQQQRDE